MDKNYRLKEKTEKISEENPLFVILESIVIFKTCKSKMSFCLNQISNVRIIKNRDKAPNVLLLVVSALFFVLSRSLFINLNLVFQILYVVLIFIFLILIFSIKNFTYKLLINIGKSGFNEIPISKNDVYHARNFVNKFENKTNVKIHKKDTNFKFKEFEKVF